MVSLNTKTTTSSHVTNTLLIYKRIICSICTNINSTSCSNSTPINEHFTLLRITHNHCRHCCYLNASQWRKLILMLLCHNEISLNPFREYIKSSMWVLVLLKTCLVSWIPKSKVKTTPLYSHHINDHNLLYLS